MSFVEILLCVIASLLWAILNQVKEDTTEVFKNWQRANDQQRVEFIQYHNWGEQSLFLFKWTFVVWALVQVWSLITRC